MQTPYIRAIISITAHPRAEGLQYGARFPKYKGGYPMKKLILLCLVALLALMLCSCGNYDLFDTNYTYDYAIVSFPDGSAKTIEIAQWTDYEGEQIQIKTEDGNTYVFHSSKCVLASEKN